MITINKKLKVLVASTIIVTSIYGGQSVLSAKSLKEDKLYELREQKEQFSIEVANLKSDGNMFARSLDRSIEDLEEIQMSIKLETFRELELARIKTIEEEKAKQEEIKQIQIALATGVSRSGGLRTISMDLRNPSGLTAEDLDKALEGKALHGLGINFIEAEKKYGVNAVFLASLAAHESGWGTSRIAKDKKNLFGFGAYDSNPYKNAIKFNTYGEGIDRVASHLKDNYLTEGGKYHNGYTLTSVNKRYASDKNWAKAISGTMSTMYSKVQ